MIQNWMSDELIEKIASSGLGSADVLAFRPPESAGARLAELLGREKQGKISPEEAAELDHFERLEHVMRLAKARARRQV